MSTAEISREEHSEHGEWAAELVREVENTDTLGQYAEMVERIDDLEGRTADHYALETLADIRRAIEEDCLSDVYSIVCSEVGFHCPQCERYECGFDPRREPVCGRCLYEARAADEDREQARYDRADHQRCGIRDDGPSPSDIRWLS